MNDQEAEILNEIRKVKEKLTKKITERENNGNEWDRISMENKEDNPQMRRIQRVFMKNDEKLSKSVIAFEKELEQLERRLDIVRTGRNEADWNCGKDEEPGRVYGRRGGPITAAEDRQRCLKQNLEELKNQSEAEQQILKKNLDLEMSKIQAMEEKTDSLSKNVQKKLEESGRIISDERHLIEDKLKKCRDAVREKLKVNQAIMKQELIEIEGSFGQISFSLQRHGLSFSVQRDACVILTAMLLMGAVQAFFCYLFWSWPFWKRGY